ncbi:MAG: GxxExxY protein [Phycisphaerales bacterium]
MSNEYQRGEYSGESRGGRHHRGGGGGGGGGRERRGIPLSELDSTLTDFSRRVIGAAIEVHKTLGPGFDRSVYHAALEAALKEDGLNFHANHDFNVEYKGKPVGKARTDFYVEERFIVEVLARLGDVSAQDRSSARAKLKAGNLDLGLIINFAERRLKDGLVRVLNVDKINADRGISSGDDHDGDQDYDDQA